MREACRDRGRLEHMLNAIDLLLSTAFDIPREKIESDVLRYYGIVKNIEIIGEAAYMLSREFKESHPEIEWDKIAAMRHVLVHDYYNIDSGEILQTLHNDLVPLHRQIEQYLK